MSENTDPQQPTWESPRSGPTSYQQPPFSTPYPPPPPPPYAPAPGNGLQPVAPGYRQDTSTAAMAHWLPILVGIWGPLILMLTTGSRDTYVRQHAVESLNFSLTLLITGLTLGVAGVLCMVAWIALPVVWILALIGHIMGATAASRGEMFRYPVNIRMVQ